MSRSCKNIDFSLFYKPVVENDDQFLKRFIEVQSIMTRMILIGRKKGKLSKAEIENEQAA